MKKEFTSKNNRDNRNTELRIVIDNEGKDSFIEMREETLGGKRRKIDFATFYLSDDDKAALKSIL